MEVSQSNPQFDWLPSYTGEPWLPYGLNGHKNLSGPLIDQTHLAATFCNINQSSKIVNSGAAVLNNHAIENTAVKYPNTASYYSAEKATRVSSNDKSEVKTALSSSKAATSMDTKSTRTLDRRRSQNRIAQRTFRERKNKYTETLEVRVNELESEVRRLRQQNQQLSLPLHDQSPTSNSAISTPCLICRHISQFWSDGMICPDSITA